MKARTSRIVPRMMFVTVVIGFDAGCNSPSSRVADTQNDTRAEPLAWFDELSRRATQRDTAFIRAHARPHVLAARPATKTATSVADPEIAFCDALMFSHPLEFAPTDDANRVMLRVAQYSAGVLGGSAWEYSIDLYRDSDGWKIDSWPYEHQSLTSRVRPPSDMREK